jgi:processive 1,2-diacylglycerol beta-glucosyltransferase
LDNILDSVVAYTLAPWESALAMLRIVGPIEAAKIRLIRGINDELISTKELPQADIALIQRDFAKLRSEYEKILLQSKKGNKPIVFDLDDLLLELPNNHPDMNLKYLPETFLPIVRSILEADAVTASTQPLCDYLKELNPNTFLLPNYFNDYIWSFQRPKSKSVDPSKIVIGYMGGNSHVPDIDTILQALIKISKKYGKSVLFKFWGLRPPSKLYKQKNSEWIPLNEWNYTKFATYFVKQECDFLIAPLADNLFNRCKSPIKLFEYTALGVSGIFSNITPYSNIIKHGKNGLLASNLEEWENCIIQLIENPSLRHEIAYKVQNTIRKNWLLSQHSQEWHEKYQKIIKSSYDKKREKTKQFDAILRLIIQLQEKQQIFDKELTRKNKLIQELEIKNLKREKTLFNRAMKILMKVQARRS